MNPSDIFFLVFSTSVEVFPGGGSIQTVGLKSSPRPWRCFRACRQCIARAQVFSTSVEVFPINRLDWRAFERLLHVRGGVSERLCNDHDSRQSSPRPWRCFLKSYRLNRNKYVFSTSVEVFPVAFLPTTRCRRLLHVRGGVSTAMFAPLRLLASSPRPWRCFQNSVGASALIRVFSTSVEVFPLPGR